MFRVCLVFLSVRCNLVITCWEMADLLALVCDVYCVLVTLPCGVLGQVWCIIVSISDLCLLSYLLIGLKWHSKTFDMTEVFLG